MPVRSTSSTVAESRRHPPRGACVSLSGDRDVDLFDLAQLLARIGRSTGTTGIDGDMDCAGDVELADLAALLSVYGTACP